MYVLLNYLITSIHERSSSTQVLVFILLFRKFVSSVKEDFTVIKWGVSVGVNKRSFYLVIEIDCGLSGLTEQCCFQRPESGWLNHPDPTPSFKRKGCSKVHNNYNHRVLSMKLLMTRFILEGLKSISLLIVLDVFNPRAPAVVENKELSCHVERSDTYWWLYGLVWSSWWLDHLAW